MKMANMDDYFDVVIVGTGAAGLYCALNLPARYRILLLTKQKADESDSFLAQGGICMQHGEADYRPFFDDTMRAGHYENNPTTVDLMIRSSNSIIRDLVRRGVRFARDDHGALRFTREGAHSRPRILFHEDITGHEITQTLLNEVLRCENIELREHTTLLDFFADASACGGVIAAGPDGEPRAIGAGAVVLACGGIGGLYKNSTNFPHITGDAIAMALRHGVACEHLDYIQIHPTTLYSHRKGRRFLISESVRGEGALLLDKNGNRFTNELQPREEGYDPIHEPIPVVPAQHYFMGGITAALSSRTALPRLYACGETCCNGVHGRNRLASNSLLESLVFAQRAADDILYGEPPVFTGDKPDLAPYREQEPLFAAYRQEVLTAIERSKNHE